MKDFKLTKQAFKQLKKLAILLIREGCLSGESLQGYSDFFKIRIGKFRLIHTTINGILIIAIIEKRETVYSTFKHLYDSSGFLDI